MRHPTPAPPAEVGLRDGLAYTLWLPAREPAGGVVIIHGAGSGKESHHDFARAARAAGLAAVCFDLRGHGDSAGELDDRLLVDVRTIAGLLPAGAPVALRGSSLGGYVALLAAPVVDAAAVVAICPAGAEHLRRMLRAETPGASVDHAALARFLDAHDARDAVAALHAPLLLLHAEGDERIPVAHSRELHRSAGSQAKRLITLPGGHHRSIQHDAELQGEALRFLARAFAERASGGATGRR